MENANKIIVATRKKFFSSENVLVVAKNQSRTVLLAQGSEEPRIYTNSKKLKLLEKVSVTLKTDLTSESSPIITLNSHESSDVIVISKLPNLVKQHTREL